LSRKKAALSLDSRYVTMVENAYYLVSPPDSPQEARKERPPIHQYIRCIISIAGQWAQSAMDRWIDTDSIDRYQEQYQGFGSATFFLRIGIQVKILVRIRIRIHKLVGNYTVYSVKTAQVSLVASLLETTQACFFNLTLSTKS
jgi:hypothetical protein